MELTLAERETHFNIAADDRGTIHVFSDDPVWMRKLDKCPGVTLKRETGTGKEYALPANWLRLQKPRTGRPLTPEHLKRMADAKSALMDVPKQAKEASQGESQ